MEDSSNSFPVPLWAGWLVNILGYILFLSTFNHAVEIVTGLLCIGCIYVGYVHKKNNSKPFLGIGLFSASRLIASSVFEAAWMFAWAFGVFDF